ncbi:MAG TPA: FAD-binding protein, partial [Candidatus Acidoferrales bacterium]|nr:FAD-binding protein [Candidatus Acidoferrales bacterium]
MAERRDALWLDTFPGVLSNEPLARHSQFGVGGPARWFLKLTDPASLTDVMRRCAETGVTVTVLGAGSNALIADAGVPGLVVRFDDRHLRVVDDATVELGGGCLMPRAA